MNRLISQARNCNHTRGRQRRVGFMNRTIGYKSQNGTLFLIDTRPIESGGVPIVTSPEAERFGASHETHTLGDGEVCLATSLRGWDLSRILFQCDGWARGLEIWKETGKFPLSPGDAFRQR